MNEKHKETITRLIHLYCEKKHQSGKNLCDECRDLLDYAHLRLEKCLYGNDKPECKHCPVHCYKPDKREQIKQVMRFVGPRLMFYDPVMFIKYMINKIGQPKVVALPHKGKKQNHKSCTE